MSTSIRRFVVNGSLGIILGIAPAIAANAQSTAGAQTPNKAPSAAKLDDATIVAIFDAANTYDVEAGVLAEQKAKNHDVHEFAEMMQRDHKAVRQQGRDLAASLKVTPTPPANSALAQAHAAAMQKLRGLSGAAFDRAYMQNEVDFHNAVIDAVTKTLLPAIQNAQLKDLVTKVAPAFVAHRDRAQNILNNLK
jgi:putative membrane protein